MLRLIVDDNGKLVDLAPIAFKAYVTIPSMPEIKEVKRFLIWDNETKLIVPCPLSINTKSWVKGSTGEFTITINTMGGMDDVYMDSLDD